MYILINILYIMADELEEHVDTWVQQYLISKNQVTEE